MKHTLKTLERDGIAWEAVLAITTTEAKAAWAAHRKAGGATPNPTPLLTAPDGNVKLAKVGVDGGVLSYGLSLAPHRDGGTNVCPASTRGCRQHCVSYAGKGDLPTVQLARKLRTSFLMTQPAAFMRLVVDEIDRAALKAEAADVQLAVRLNTFSDVAWERVVPWLFEMFDGVRFYDYTKRYERIDMPANYTLTFSATEATTVGAIQGMVGHHNVAVVFDTPRSKPLPATYGGVPVIDGDKTDVRWADPDGVIVGLRAKGKLRTDNRHGFAVKVDR